jgi:hypothetical protein
MSTITDAEIEATWGNANFGEDNSRKRFVVNQTLLKVACKYGAGFTALQICEELGLLKNVRKTPAFTTKGWDYFYATTKSMMEKEGVVQQ